MPGIQWNLNHEIFLKKLVKEINIISEMHKHVAMNYSKKNTYLGTPSIIIGSVATSSVFLNSQNNYMVYVNGSLVLMTTLMTSLRNWLDYSNRAIAHKQQSIDYESLAIDITTELHNDMLYRQPVDEFMKEFKERYIALKKSPVNIPDHVYEKFMDKVEVFMSKLTDQDISDFEEESVTEKILSCCRSKPKSYHLKNHRSVGSGSSTTDYNKRGMHAQHHRSRTPSRIYSNNSNNSDVAAEADKVDSIGSPQYESYPMDITTTTTASDINNTNTSVGQGSIYHMQNIEEHFMGSLDGRISNIL